MNPVGTRVETMEDAFVNHDDGSLFLQLAEAYSDAGDYDRALGVLRKGLERHPSFTPAFSLMGRVLLAADRLGEALICFEQLIEMDPADETARASLETIAVRLGRPVAVRTITPPAASAPAMEATPMNSVTSETRAPQTAPWDPGTELTAPMPATPDVKHIEQALAKAEPATHEELLAKVGHVDSTAVALADMLVGLLEYRDPFFRGGTSLTRLLTSAIGREMGLDAEHVKAIALGAVLRDLGQIPLKGLINKPGGQLDAEDRKKMERHVETALAMLEGVQLPPATRDTIRFHHERWDGKGYPEHRAGDAIPLGARIVAVADSFAAMIAARPHRLPMRVPAALDNIRSGAGQQYDPGVVEALVRVLSSTNWQGLRFGLRHHVLIVDPDETRAMVLATKLCSHGYLAEAAFSIEASRERLKQTRIVCLVISSELNGEEEVALLREVRETSRIGMIPVIMTDTGVSDRVPLLEAGADVCLNRGASFEELKATLEAFLRREGKAVPSATAKATEAPWSGLQGDIQDFPLNWLLQVLNYDSRSAAVFLVGPDDEGAIYLEKGNVRHAQTKTLRGDEAFRLMARWKTGTFTVDPEAKTEELTVKTPLMNLLLDQAVQEDHAAFFGSVKTEA
jgi:response regulator RpfG family c-di-GMP phosphodiesterase